MRIWTVVVEHTRVLSRLWKGGRDKLTCHKPSQKKQAEWQNGDHVYLTADAMMAMILILIVDRPYLSPLSVIVSSINGLAEGSYGWKSVFRDACRFPACLPRQLKRA